MALQLFVTHYEAKTEAAEQFCKDYSRWMELSTVNDIHAFEELFNQFCDVGLTDEDEFTIYFDGDYKTSVDSNELHTLKP